MTKQIVTRDSIRVMLNNDNPTYVMQVIGRALVGIFNNQTMDEQACNTTTKSNGIGFAGCDARSGSMTAKYFLKHKRLEQWMVDKWLTINAKSQYPRLCKYHAQLDQIAQTKLSSAK